MDIDVILSTGAFTIPLIVAVCQLWKNMTPLSFSRYTPLVAIIIGILISWLVEDTDVVSYRHIILSGLVLGLSSVGLYSSTVTLVKRDVLE